MKRFTTYFAKLTTPLHQTPEDGIRYWQEKILSTLLLVSLILGFITWIPSVALSVKEELWAVAVLDTLILAFVAVLVFRRDLPYQFRASAFPVISYILGLVLLATIGPFGAGPVWLFFFPVLTGILLGQKQAGYALGLNAATMTVLGALIHTGLSGLPEAFPFRTWYLSVENPLEKWIVISLNFMLLDILATLSVTAALGGLHTSLEKLGRSEKRYRRVFDNILDVYFETSPDGKILEVSPSVETISGYSRDTLLGADMSDYYEMPGERQIFIRDLIRTNRADDYEIRMKDGQNRVHTCSVRARLIRDAEGAPSRIIGIFRDITEQKAMADKKRDLEEQLNRSKKMEALGLLAGGVAHDLNNVLSGLVTYPELLLSDLPPDDPMRESLSVILSSGRRATQIVQDLLTLSRRGVTSPEVLNLNTMVTRFMQTPEYRNILARTPGIQVETDLSAETPFVKGSLVHLQKSVMNLVANAVEAQSGGGWFRVSTQNTVLDTPIKGYDQVRRGTYVKLTVEDHGIGIPKKDLERIFEPFFTTKSMGRSGTGLGMAVVWGTVQDHLGYIDVHSEPGKGSRFDLYFPTTRETGTKTGRTTTLDTLGGSGETILVVDDSPDQRKIASKTLTRLGYGTVVLPDGEAAVAYLETGAVDLVILDMIMEGGIDGAETLRRIRRFKPGQKAVIASGYARNRMVESALALGNCLYIRKPYSLREIAAVVKQALSSHNPGPAG